MSDVIDWIQDDTCEEPIQVIVSPPDNPLIRKPRRNTRVYPNPDQTHLDYYQDDYHLGGGYHLSDDGPNYEDVGDEGFDANSSTYGETFCNSCGIYTTNLDMKLGVPYCEDCYYEVMEKYAC